VMFPIPFLVNKLWFQTHQYLFSIIIFQRLH